MPKPNFYYVGDCGPWYHTECKIAYWLWRTIPFVLLIIGTCGNIVNIIVLSRKQLRKYPTTTFLLVLAVTELTVLWASSVPDTVLGITGIRLIDLSPVTCRLGWWLALTSGSYSTWILVLLTLERILLTKAPHFYRTNVKPKRALIVSLAVLLVIALLNSHMIFWLRFYDISVDNVGKNISKPVVPFNCYFSSAEYAKFYFGHWQIIVLAIYNAVLAGIIIIGNINIAVTLALRRKRLARVHPSRNPSDNVSRKYAEKMLFIVSAFYVFLTTPWCIYYIARGGITELSKESFAKWQLATAVVNILVGCNFSFNFFFYFVSGTLFKIEWKKLVEKAKNRCRRPQRNTTGTTSYS